MSREPLLQASSQNGTENGTAVRVHNARVNREYMMEDPDSISLKLGEVVQVLYRKGAWAKIKTISGNSGDVPVESLDMEDTFCVCGHVLEPDSRFCRRCGTSRANSEGCLPSARRGAQTIQEAAQAVYADNARLREELDALKRHRGRALEVVTEDQGGLEHAMRGLGSPESKLKGWEDMQTREQRDLSFESKYHKGKRTLTDMGRRKWDEAGLKPSHTQILEYCLVNARSAKQGFPHKSSIWLPCDLKQGGSELIRWFPVRVLKKRPRSVLPQFLHNLLGGFITQADASHWSLSSTLVLEVETTSANVKKKFDTMYNQKDCKEQDQINKINQATTNEARSACAAILTEQRGQVEADRQQQEVRLFLSLQRILSQFGGSETQNSLDYNLQLAIDEWELLQRGRQIQIFTAHEGSNMGELEDCLEDLKSALGKKPESHDEGPGYEEAYLCLHSLLYFAFLVIFFCSMVAFSTYLWTQFFFLFLLGNEGGQGQEDHNIRMVVYFFILPGVLMGLSVTGFEVTILIRSTVKSPQMSRQRALGAGLCVKALTHSSWLRPWYNSIVGHLEGRVKFFAVLKAAMRAVDTWFTIGLECCMSMGCICIFVHAHLTHRIPFYDFPAKIAISLLITGVTIWCLNRMASENATEQHGRWEDRLGGRMLHWDRNIILAMCMFLYIFVLCALVNIQFAYEGITIGGTFWAGATIIFHSISDLVLTQDQRVFMKLVERCLDDRNIQPGRMLVRFYEIRNKLEQQMLIEGLSAGAFDAPDKSKTEDESLVLESLEAIQSWEEESLRQRVTKLWESVTVRNAILIVGIWGTACYLIISQTDEEILTWVIEVILFIFIVVDTGSGRWIALPGFALMSYLSLIASWGPYMEACGLSKFNFKAGLTPETQDIFEKAFKAASPTLILIPVMVLGHRILVRRMPVLSQGSHKETSNPQKWYFNIYHAFMIFYSAGSVVWFLLGIVQSSAPMARKNVDELGMFRADAQIHNTMDRNSVTYPVCQMQWGAPGMKLGVLDMAILSKYAYSDTNSTFEYALSKSFESEDYSVDMLNVTTTKTLPYMTEARFKSNNGKTTIVLGIRGTSNIEELFADASLYSGVAILGFISQFVDLFDLVSNQMIGYILNNLRLPPVFKLEHEILARAVARVKELKEQNADAYVVITGHSLGGGIAGAVGGITSTPTITFSAPGNHFNRYMFSTNMERTWRNVVNVWPERDVVPLVDRHEEMVQRIACRNPGEGNQLDPGTCHLIGTTICELWRVCGDTRGRNMTLCTDVRSPMNVGNYGSQTWNKYLDIPPEEPTEPADFDSSSATTIECLPGCFVCLVLSSLVMFATIPSA